MKILNDHNHFQIAIQIKKINTDAMFQIELFLETKNVAFFQNQPEITYLTLLGVF